MVTHMEIENPPPDRVLTAGEAAARLSVSVSTLAKWCRAGKIPAVRTLGGHRRFRESEIDAIVASVNEPQDAA